MEIRIESVSIKRHDISTRMPFKYGIATMTDLPHLFIRIVASFDGNKACGISADHLPPKWFTKDPNKDPLDEIDDMEKVIRKAAALAQTLSADSVFNFWLKLYQHQDTWAEENQIPPLLVHFGTSLIERALIDAFCRQQQSSFATLLHENAFGITWGKLRPELAGQTPKDLFPPPLQAVIARHTVGLADPLTEADIQAADRINDGLPQSLEACIPYYGLKHFKIKVNGKLDEDIPRLEAIAILFDRLQLGDFKFSLDGNEQFTDAESFQEFWRELQTVKGMMPFLDHLLFVEQPFHRDFALRETIGDALRSWKEAPSIIIDESDASLDSAPRALELGYTGTSHKNCKGVFKGILNRAMINYRNGQAGVNRLLMSGEDLANIGPIANHQDLVVQAALGNASVERNGHHYFKGLSVFDQEIQDNALNSFPGMYKKEDSGYVRLKVREGSLDLTDLLKFPFGTDSSHFESRS
jgi:hypothetical protein